MLDVGWTELLVIAIVLIVVVGPKDLPPMIRAFGRTMANLRKITGEFRTQFDQALKEADMDDVRKTISDVQNLNPSNALRDAINPLRQMGDELRSDLQKSVSMASIGAAAAAPAPASAVTLPEPQMKLPDSPPMVPLPVVADQETVSTEPAAEVVKSAKPAPKPRAKKKAAEPAKAKAEAAEKATPAKKVTPAKKAPARKKAEKVEKVEKVKP